MTDFSPREIEVLRQLAAGKRNVEIAADLGVKPRTISQFKARAAVKLGLDHPSDITLVKAAQPYLDGGEPPAPIPKAAPASPVAPNADDPTPIGDVDAGPYLPAAPKWADAELVVMVAEYPGTPNWKDWQLALPNIKARIEDGVDYNKLRLVAMKYRRQHAALTRRAVEELMAAGVDPDAARRQAKPVPIIKPQDMFDVDGKWRSSFPLPAFVEIPPEPVGDS